MGAVVPLEVFVPQFHVTGRDVYGGQKWEALVQADSAEAAERFVSARNIAPLAVVRRADEVGLPADILRMRVPVVVVAEPSAPMGRRLKLAAIGVGIGLFVIAGVLFVNRAKEHLLRGDLIPKEMHGATQNADGKTRK